MSFNQYEWWHIHRKEWLANIAAVENVEILDMFKSIMHTFG